MTIESDNFEKQVKRIHEVLVQDHGEVTWNDKIPDPDNPEQSRQIDITVRRNDEIIHIECRHHKAKQNSKWIEELLGRKISLEATIMIGVSSSGFSEGAIKKAKRYGIFLCNLSQLTEKEVKSWGKKTKIKFLYYQFSNLEICLFLDSIKGLNGDKIQKDIFSKPEYYDSLFNQIKYELARNKGFYYPYGFKFTYNTSGNVEILKMPVIGVSVRGDVDKVGYDYECPSILSYHSPNKVSQAIATVEKTENFGLEIIKSSSGFATVGIDLRIAPQAPPNSVFAGVEFGTLPASRKYPPKVNVIGSHEQPVYIDEAQFVVAEIK